MSKVFIDTNILVYAYDADAGSKHKKSQAVLQTCWEDGNAVISLQVLQEFYVTVTRKLPHTMSKQQARDIVETYQAWPVFSPAIEDVMAASALEERYKLAFWDALIIVAAQKLGAAILYSEDLQDGQRFDSVTVNNPLN